MEVTPRTPRVYWIRRPEGEKDLLIFDAGHWGGSIYIYEYKESHLSKEIEEEMKVYYHKDELPKEIITEIVRLWIEKNFGYPNVEYKIILE